MKGVKVCANIGKIKMGFQNKVLPVFVYETFEGELNKIERGGSEKLAKSVRKKTKNLK